MPALVAVICGLVLLNSSFAMRCQDSQGIGRMVYKGDSRVMVMLKCQPPDYKYSPGLLLEQEIWVYRRENGMIYHINFLQGTVQSIDVQRP
ncbi:MAG: DUF2845 domain-containing protein [Legionellaceae bacterium]|nr:DUF2845 domain-containing protein [Legionellaceae bacterium]